MIYSLHPAAEKELAEATAFYKQRASIAVAEAFLADYEKGPETSGDTARARNSIRSDSSSCAFASASAALFLEGS